MWVGSLIYLKSDIAYAVHLVNQFMTAPRSVHYAVVLRSFNMWRAHFFMVFLPSPNLPWI